MATRGRPTFVPNDKQRGQVEAMHICGIPEKDIAVALDISEKSIAFWITQAKAISQTSVRARRWGFSGLRRARGGKRRPSSNTRTAT
jgi:hypothetical protein